MITVLENHNQTASVMDTTLFPTLETTETTVTRNMVLNSSLHQKNDSILLNNRSSGGEMMRKNTVTDINIFDVNGTNSTFGKLIQSSRNLHNGQGKSLSTIETNIRTDIPPKTLALTINVYENPELDQKARDKYIINPQKSVDHLLYDKIGFNASAFIGNISTSNLTDTSESIYNFSSVDDGASKLQIPLIFDTEEPSENYSNRKNINSFNKSKNPLQNASNLSILNELSTKQIELHGNNNENDSRPTQDLSSVFTFLPVTSLKPTLINNDSSDNSTFDIESKDNEDTSYEELISISSTKQPVMASQSIDKLQIMDSLNVSEHNITTENGFRLHNTTLDDNLPLYLNEDVDINQTKENAEHTNLPILPITDSSNALELVNHYEDSTYPSAVEETHLSPKSLEQVQSSNENSNGSTSDTVTHSNELKTFENKAAVKNLQKIVYEKKSVPLCNDISCSLNNINSKLPEQRIPISIIVNEVVPKEFPVGYQKNKLHKNRIVESNGIIAVDKDLEHVNEEINAFNLNGMEDDSGIGNRNADHLRNLFSTMPTKKTSLLKGKNQVDDSNQNFKEKLEGPIIKKNNSKEIPITSNQNFDENNSATPRLNNIRNTSMVINQMRVITTSSSVSFESTGLNNIFGIDNKHTEENYPPVTSAMDFKSSTETNDENSVQLKGAPKLKNYRNVTEYNDTKAHETSIETPLKVLKEENSKHRNEGKIMKYTRRRNNVYYKYISMNMIVIVLHF